MKRILFFIFTISLLVISNSYGNKDHDKFIDVPYFKALPNDSISKVFSVFGESKIIKTQLAHSYVLYYDYKDKIGLIVAIYQLDNESIWQITMRKEESADAILKLHKYASLGLPEQEESKLYKPKNIELPDKLTLEGLKFGMSQKEVEAILKTKLSLKDGEASIVWKERKGGEIIDYGSVDLKFFDGKLTSISWYGVDP